MKSFLKSKKFIALVIILVIGGGYWYSQRNGDAPLEMVTVQKSEVVQEVRVTGRVKPVNEVNLSFEKAGKVSGVFVQVGDQVKAGQALVSLDSSDLLAQLAQAQANVDSAKANLSQYHAGLNSEQAKLSELKAGTRSEELTVKQAAVKKSSQDLDNYYVTVVATLQDAFNKADDAVRSKISPLFYNPEKNNYTLSFVCNCGQAEIDATSQRLTVELDLNKWRQELDRLDGTTDRLKLDEAMVSAKTHLNLVSQLLKRIGDAVSSNTTVLDKATQQTYQANINIGRTNVTTAGASINTLTNNISAQRLTLQQYQSELDLALAGNRLETIQAQEGVVEQARAKISAGQASIASAEAQVQNINSQLSKMVLRSPLTGTVTTQDAKVGQIVAITSTINPVVSIMSLSSFEIEASVPEVDIGNIVKGSKVDITLDAFAGESFTGQVIAIEPAETIIDGVVNFKVTILFDKEDARIKSGLTANLAIAGLSKQDVLWLPQYAIVEKDSGNFAQKIVNGKVQEVPVVIGLRGRDSRVEIVSGLPAGEQVVNVGVKKNGTK